MKTEIYGIIYLTTNNINNKKYIGQHKTKNIDDSYLGSGHILKRSIERYGKENFTRTILDIAFSKEELSIKEICWIKYYNAVKSDEFYNIHIGGSGGYTIAGYSDRQLHEFKQKMKKINSGVRNGMYGKSHSTDTKIKISNTRRMKNYPYFKTDEFRSKMSAVTKGANNGMYGKNHSIKAREKMSINSKGKTLASKNGMYGKKGKDAINGKQIIQYKDANMTELVNVFNTVLGALEYLDIKGHVSLNKAIKNKTMYKGYYWSKKKRCRDYSERK